MRGCGSLASRGFTALVLLTLVSGCAVGPDYAQPEIPTPDSWHQDLLRGLSTGEANLQTWWTVFDDELLTSLIHRAAAGNLDLRGAVARIAEAAARRGIAVGAWFPSVGNSTAVGRQQISEEFNGIPPFENPGDFYSLGFDASWEIDFFGRIRRSVESADASLGASIENYRDVLVILYAAVASAYVDARTFQERIRIAELNVRNQRGTLQLVIDRNRAGLVGDLDVRQAELNLAQTESAIPIFREGYEQTVNRLGVLLGDFPSALKAEMEPVQPIPQAPDAVPVGLPVNLLRQRPDLRRAERELAAQTAQIGVATADLYPRFTLLGTFAFEATDVASWITGNAQAWSFGPAARWAIFDGGRIRANIRAQDALTQQLLIQYEQTTLNALEDVENGLVAYVQEQDRRDKLQRSVRAASESVRLVKELYRTGLTDFQNVLDMERSLFREQDNLAVSEGRVTLNLIGIYRALGGGWTP